MLINFLISGIKEFTGILVLIHEWNLNCKMMESCYLFCVNTSNYDIFLPEKTLLISQEKSECNFRRWRCLM